MDTLLDVINRLGVSTYHIALEAAPWLLFGLLFAGVIRAWLPEKAVARWLGDSKWSVLRAAVIGTPLPLCSCGVVPAAMGLRRAGASKPATVSFLVATPENGADSIALSYALLGPVMAVARVVAAFICAIGAGLITLVADRRTSVTPESVELPVAESACCSSKPTCCGTAPAPPGAIDRLGEGLHYALSKLLDDLVLWLVVGLVVSGAIMAFVPKDALAQWGSGPLAMIVMAIVGVPMYVCATAATPVAAGLIAAGVGPGAALVFLLAGPATNLGTVGIVRKELGTGALIAYLVGVVGLSVACGLGLEALLRATGWVVSIDSELGAHGMLIPGPIAFGCLLVLVVFAIRPLRRTLIRFAG